jgi:hypothetical protein
LRDVLALRLEKFGPRFEPTLFIRSVLARLLESTGRAAEAETQLCRLLEDGADLVPDPRIVLSFYDWLARLRLTLGRPNDALASRLDAYAFAERALPESAPERFDAALALAATWQQSGCPRAALTLLEPLRDRVADSAAGIPIARVTACRAALIACYDALGLTRESAAVRATAEAESTRQ